jgi:cysteine-rich repeat protein
MSRAQCRLRLLLFVAVAVLGSHAVARAADVPLPGKLLLIKDTKVAKVISKTTGAPFTVPTFGGPTDPTANPSSLLIDDLGGAGALTEADLATGSWRALGNPPGSRGYIYTNSGAGAGPDPVKKILVKSRIIKVLARDDGTLDGPVAGAVEMFLNLGSDTYCARFGGQNVKNTAGFVRRKDAPAPPDCSVPPPPVCGNGMAEAPDEECDDGGTSAGDGCDATCQLESTNPAVCAGVPSASGTTLAMTLVADDLESPVHVAAPRLDTNRIFIVEQPGRIRVVRNGVLAATPYLNIEPLVAYTSSGTEQGLLSVAFDPDFETNGFFFVYYVDNSGNVVVARYEATGDPSSSDDADETSAVIVTTVPHPGAGNHNGGQLGLRQHRAERAERHRRARQAPPPRPERVVPHQSRQRDLAEGSAQSVPLQLRPGHGRPLHRRRRAERVRGDRRRRSPGVERRQLGVAAIRGHALLERGSDGRRLRLRRHVPAARGLHVSGPRVHAR